jgi:hypothetical protein
MNICGTWKEEKKTFFFGFETSYGIVMVCMVFVCDGTYVVQSSSEEEVLRGIVDCKISKWPPETPNASIPTCEETSLNDRAEDNPSF